MKHKYWLFVIFLTAFVLRVYKLGSLPFNFHEDEILSGYVGRYILLNGRDLYNNSWPLLYFNKFGDYYIILPMYIKGIFTFIFGVNEFAVRFPTALVGSLGIFPVYFLAKWIFNNKSIGLISGFLLAITPWHIVMSRANAEGVLGATIVVSGIVLLLKWTSSHEKKYLLSASLLFFISYFIYHPYRIIIPLALLPIPLAFIGKKNVRFALIHSVLLAGAFFALTLYISTTVWGNSRFQQTSIFSPLSGVSIKIQELIYAEGNNQVLTAKLFHNKLVGYGREFVTQYSSYFSINYLFLQGGRSYAYKVPEHGLYYISFAGLGILALLFLSNTVISIVKKNESAVRLMYLFYLILISVVPSALTVLDAPNVHRSVILSLFLAIIFGYGLYSAWNIRFKMFRFAHIFMIVIAVEFIYFWHQYNHADFFNAIYRNDAQKQLVKYIKNDMNSTPVIMPVQNTMPLYYLFYTNDFDASYATRFKLDARIDKIHNVTFYEDECPSIKLKDVKLDPDTVFVDSHNCESDLTKYDLITKITGKNSLLSFKILKLKPKTF